LPGLWITEALLDRAYVGVDSMKHITETLEQNGLYRPAFERENCGFGLIAHMDGKPSHWLVKTAIHALERLTHRGAIAADGKSGDGCGLLLKKPDSFLRGVAEELGYKLADHYAAGMVFLNAEPAMAEAAREKLQQELTDEGLQVVGWRVVPINPDACGAESLKTLPQIEQLFVNCPAGMDDSTFERHLYIARRRCEKAIEPHDKMFYVPTLSGNVISYKGLVMPENLPVFYQDLNNDALESALCVFHQRFSTNTWPQSTLFRVIVIGQLPVGINLRHRISRWPMCVH
jgi:glutamate synthase (NADPH/NADH) large chain